MTMERRCIKCGQRYPWTKEHFYPNGEKDTLGQDRLRTECKECNKRRRNEYARSGRTHWTLRQQAFRAANGRLRDMYPHLYFRFLAEEYAERGLPAPRPSVNGKILDVTESSRKETTDE